MQLDDLDLDQIPLTFGKYKGRTPTDVAELDPKYIIWAFDNVKALVCSKQLRDYCYQDILVEEEEHAMDTHFGLDGW